MRAVIYARYSSDRQREESITSQLRVCHDYAEKKQIKIVREYTDRALSGKAADNRPEFLRMIADSEKRLFDAVIVYRLDRFARNRYDSAIFKARLKKNGVVLLSAMEQLSDNPESIILESVLEGMAEYYSLELSQKVRRGMKENALQCKSVGGQVPLGYKIGDDKKFEIEEIGAAAVRLAFHQYADGKSLKEICDELNERGYRTSRGAMFNKCSLTRMLQNKKYIGYYVFDGTEVEGGMPKIIEEDIFNEVREKVQQRSTHSARKVSNVNYVLTPKLFCGACGALMVGESGTSSTGKTYNYYKCNTRKFQKQCNAAQVQKEWIERLIVEETRQNILTPENIEIIAERCSKILQEESDNDAILNSLKGKLRDTQRAVSNMLKVIEETGSDYATQRLIELEQVQCEIEMQIAEESKIKPVFNKTHFIFWLSRFVAGDVDDSEYRRTLISTLVRRVIMFEHKIIVEYNISEGMDKVKTIIIKDIKESELPTSDSSDNSALVTHRRFERRTP